ncbi:beta-ketoacyl-[acyl-carrier-protein] synthase family protein [Streptomyces sp. NPDC054796]
MSGHDVAVTGLGLLTPAGIGVGETWEGVRAGRSTATADPELAGLPVEFSCRLPDVDIDARLGRRLSRRVDRFSAMALIAAREAVADAGLGEPWQAESEGREADWDPDRVAVLLGVGSNSLATYPEEFGRLNEERPDRVSPLALPRSVPNFAASEVSTDLGAAGPSMAISTACSSGAMALGTARSLIESGACDVVIAGGSESARAAMTAACFAQMRALSQRGDEPERASRPFDAERDGFVLGEGAGILVLERAEHARARSARVYARLTGFGASCDAYHVVAPRPDGEGIVGATRAALADSGWEPQDVGHINAHATSTRLNDRAEAHALHRLFGTPPPVTATKSVIGHSLGAAGAIEAATTVLSVHYGTIPPTANLDTLDEGIDLDVVTGKERGTWAPTALSNSFGFGGQNAVLAFEGP